MFSYSKKVSLSVCVYVPTTATDPNPFADFFSVLGAEEGEENFLSFLSTHPAAGERAAELKKRIAELPEVPTYQGDAAKWDTFLGSL